MDIKSELATLRAKNASIIADVKASGRNLTEAEAAEMERDADRMFQLKTAIARGEKNAALMDGFNEGAGGTEDRYDGGLGGKATEVRTASGAKGYVTPASLKRMAAAQVADIEAKGLVAAGSNVTKVEFDPKPQVLATPGANLGILDVLAVKTRDSAKYSYVRQTVRTNNADVVPAGSLKPTSVFTVEEVEGSLDVVAHMSEYVGTYLLKDNDALEGFLVAELRAGIFAKVAELAVADPSPGAWSLARVLPSPRVHGRD
ncbi:hypothetical protein [Microbacterium oxydans]|uniref:hypothetical protein n=1 Tax=Microbacterium oxydans TaxID=82380 RepID=UPI00226B922A|nr:hypothetical protein [Microbacterium oxydans]WAA67792.1 hypothetical protein MME74_08560 [Microbacterium oxydans]